MCPARKRNPYVCFESLISKIRTSMPKTNKVMMKGSEF